MSVVRDRPDVAARLLDLIGSWDGPMRDFKRADAHAALRPWLQAAAW